VSSVLQFSINHYGTARYACSLDGATFTACGPVRGSSVGSYTASSLVPGRYCLSVYATDEAGNVGPTASDCWREVSLVLEPVAGGGGALGVGRHSIRALVVRLVDARGRGVSGANVTFAAPAAGASLSFGACSRGATPGGGTCSVTTNARGYADSATLTANGTIGSYVVTVSSDRLSSPITLARYNSASFTMVATASNALSPGVDALLNLSFSNPNTLPITVAASSVQVTLTTSVPTCSAANYRVLRGLRTDVVVPAGATVSLSSLGIATRRWPLLTMLDTATNQDACRGVALALTLTGSATG
jgi:hypothetical protein